MVVGSSFRLLRPDLGTREMLVLLESRTQNCGYLMARFLVRNDRVRRAEGCSNSMRTLEALGTDMAVLIE